MTWFWKENEQTAKARISESNVQRHQRKKGNERENDGEQKLLRRRGNTRILLTKNRLENVLWEIKVKVKMRLNDQPREAQLALLNNGSAAWYKCAQATLQGVDDLKISIERERSWSNVYSAAAIHNNLRSQDYSSSVWRKANEPRCWRLRLWEA